MNDEEIKSQDFEMPGSGGPVPIKNLPYAVIKLFIFSAFGVIFFFAPIFDGATPLLVSINWAKAALGTALNAIVVLCCVALMFATPFSKKVPFLNKYMGTDGVVTKVLYVLGSIFGIMIFAGIGPDWLLSADTGGLAMSLAGSVLLTVALAGIFVTFIANFGMLQFIGTMLEPLMRPLYRLPGYAAVDAATSIACSAAVDVFMANKIYLNKLYTKRDVAVVASNFTICSLGFFLLLCQIAKIPEQYGAVVLTSFGISFIMPIITARIPPLSLIPNEYCDGTPYTGDEKKNDSRNVFKRAWDSAIEAADQATAKMIVDGAVESLMFSIKVCTYVMSVATIALVLGVYTPVFQWLGVPVAPLLQLVGVPNAAQVAPSVLIGITEIAMPALLIADQNVAPAAAFFVVVLSTVQVVFFTESANAIMESDIPLGAGKLIIMFLLRTLIAIPMVALVMHFLF